MTTDVLRQMAAGPIPRHKDDRELLRLFADWLWPAFCDDMAAQYRRGVEEGERRSVERADSSMRDALREALEETEEQEEGERP